VDVEFAAADVAGKQEERPEDRIVEVSKPHLELSNAD